MSAPHGFELSPEDDLLLRSPPPRRALRWCERELGAGAAVLGAEALRGGTSSAVHLLQIGRRGSRVDEQAVLRRFVRSDWLDREPDLANREAEALRLIAAGPVPAPALIATDDDGSDAGAPATLMSAIDGEIDWTPADPEAHLSDLARVLPAIHATPVPPGHGLPDYEPHELEADGPPPSAADPATWNRAFELFASWRPGDERRFIHRDYHPGNVLWLDRSISGVVDWVNASVGQPDADVGHCRMNLASELGLGAADRFLEIWLKESGRQSYDPVWDVLAALGGMSPEELEAQCESLEAFLAAALSPR